MSKNVIQYDLLISCPGDVQDEIDVINQVVEHFNNQYTDVLDIHVRTKHWSKNSYPESGGEPQKLLNKQFVKSCDAAIAIFWTRFGTPTDKYNSGTEEEIEEMLEAGKQVFMYFSEKPLPPSQTAENIDEYNKICEYKERYKAKGLFYTYSSNDELEKKLFAHLSQYFLSLQTSNKMQQKKSSNLNVRSITDTGFSTEIYPYLFNNVIPLSTSALLDEVKNLYGTINLEKCEIDKDEEMNIRAANKLFQALKPVELQDETIEVISSFAQTIGYELSEGFFSLGLLSVSTMPSLSQMGGHSYTGNKNEKVKYGNILKLRDKILKYVNWIYFCDTFNGLSCIKLVVRNEGTTFDEDIDIILKIPKKMIILHRELPIPKSSTVEYVNEHSSMNEIFGITNTASYNDFDSSIMKPNRNIVSYTPQPVFPFVNTRDYREDYLDNLDDVFIYQIYNQDEHVLLKLHIDYIKHNTSVAFPSVIFVTNELVDVTYSITSKHGESIIEGTITVV